MQRKNDIINVTGSVRGRSCAMLWRRLGPIMGCLHKRYVMLCSVCEGTALLWLRSVAESRRRDSHVEQASSNSSSPSLIEMQLSVTHPGCNALLQRPGDCSSLRCTLDSARVGSVTVDKWNRVLAADLDSILVDIRRGRGCRARQEAARGRAAAAGCR